MFDWNQFIILSYLLLREDGEEYVRSAISRLYYGLFGVLRRYLINVKSKGYLQNRNGNVHRKVYLELKHSGDVTQNEISEIFNKLRVVRNQADYDGNFDVSYFKKFLYDNKKDLEIAFGAIDYFKNHPDYWGVQMSDVIFKDEIDLVNHLENDDDLFEREFVKINDDYPFKNYAEIHDFCSENRGLIIILNKVKPLLKKYVPYASFHLELDVDPLFGSQLLLVVKALDYDFNNGFKEDIKSINDEIGGLILNLNLGAEFFIFDTSCNVSGKSSLSLLEVSRHYSGYYNQ